MKAVAAFTLILALFLGGLVPDSAACRIILPPEPPQRPQLTPMRVKQHRVSIDIRDQVARVTVRAVFYNPNGRRIEGTYYFPIAPDAAVNSFTMTVNGKTMEADLLPADKARKIYEDIVRSQQDPAILEYIDQGMLRARVFPIEPQSDVTIELSYDQHIRRDGPMARFRYPLISARPQSGPIESLVIEATIDGKSSLKTVFVPGYDATVSRPSDRQARIGFEATNITPERDFEILLSRQTGKVGIDFLPYKKGNDGYYMLLVSPQSELQAEEIAAKDITFVVDTSGSMSGEKMRQAQEALRFSINSLNPTDSFNVIAFATDVMPLAEASLPATDENRKKALAFIDDMKARGGTNIYDALQMAIQQKRADGKVPIIVFLTDGLPTIAKVDPDEILKLTEAKDLPRIFSFGVGHGVNTRLLNGLAKAGAGYPTYVQPDENLELALSAFYERIASPVMTDLKLDTGDLRFTETSPPALPDLFRGAQIVATGRYTGSGKHTITLSGDVNGTREQFRVEIDLDSDALNSFVPRLWAIQRVGYLQEQILLNGEKAELVEEIQRLGREYGIATRYTSFLIVEEGLKDRVRREMEQTMTPRPGSAGFADDGEAAVADATSTEAMKSAGSGRGQANFDAPAAPSGDVGARLRDNVDGGKKMDDDELMRQYVITVEDRTFYRRASDDYLYDSAIAKGTTPTIDVDVKVWSDEFFALLKEHPEIRHYLRAGNRLVIKLDNKTIRIHD